MKDNCVEVLQVFLVKRGRQSTLLNNATLLFCDVLIVFIYNITKKKCHDISFHVFYMIKTIMLIFLWEPGFFSHWSAAWSTLKYANLCVATEIAYFFRIVLRQGCFASSTELWLTLISHFGFESILFFFNIKYEYIWKLYYSYQNNTIWHDFFCNEAVKPNTYTHMIYCWILLNWKLFSPQWKNGFPIVEILQYRCIEYNFSLEVFFNYLRQQMFFLLLRVLYCLVITHTLAFN